MYDSVGMYDMSGDIYKKYCVSLVHYASCAVKLFNFFLCKVKILCNTFLIFFLAISRRCVSFIFLKKIRISLLFSSLYILDYAPDQHVIYAHPSISSMDSS